MGDSHRGKTLSLEHKRKLSKSCSGKNCKQVIDTSNGKTYKSLKEASETVGFSYGTLARKLNGNRRNNTNLKYI